MVRDYAGPLSCPRMASMITNITDILIPSSVESSVVFKIYNLQVYMEGEWHKGVLDDGIVYFWSTWI